MKRPRWHGWLIAIAFVALTAGGVFAIWGDTIVSWFESEEPSDEPPPAGPATQPL